jgi:stage II sporulation protein P
VYEKKLKTKITRPKVNIGVIILILFIGIFSYRVMNILSNTNERGGFAYVQFLNFGMPLIENEIYDEGAYAENKLSISAVCLEAVGLSNIDNFFIVNNEVNYYKQGFSSGTDTPTFTLNSFNINDSTVAKIDKSSNAGNDSLKKTLDQSKIEVLIYHSHTTENYAEAGGDTLDENYSVVGVGNEVTRELEENYGIAVIHDKTNHSVSYNNSYDRSNETVSRYLKKYGDFKMIIDIHRDSIANKSAVTTNINGESAAKIMFVTAKNSTKYSKNQALVDELYNKANELFPGLTKPTYTYNRGINGFNQGLSDGSLLIECGSDNNTSAEAQASARYIARLIAEHINKK